SPPVAATRKSPLGPDGANTITLALPQAPPRGVKPLAIVCGDPPAASIRFNFPSAKKAIDLLSGDQKGYAAFSVPRRGCAAEESSLRTQSSDWPSAGLAANASFSPSGDRTGAAASKSKMAFSAAFTLLTTSCCSGGFCLA